MMYGQFFMHVMCHVKKKGVDCSVGACSVCVVEWVGDLMEGLGYIVCGIQWFYIHADLL